MSLLKELKIQTLVFLAHKSGNKFKPSLFNQYWLDKNGIISADKISEDSTFTANGVIIKSEAINMVVLDDQLQISSTETGDFKSVVTKNCVSLLNNIGIVDLTGMGLNLTFLLSDESEKITELTKKLFYNPSSIVSSKFDQDDAKYGMYISKNVSENVRLKLDIRPITITNITNNTKQEYIQCAFNFHSDLISDNPIDLAIEILAEYDKWKNITQEIIDSINL